MSTPHDVPDLYAKILLGRTPSPGVVTLSGHDREESWDVVAAKGQTGASSTHNGQAVGQFQATFYLADEDDLFDWYTFQKILESTTNGETPAALPIYHPALATAGFSEVCNAGIGGLVWDDRGGANVTVKFIEYRPPKPKPAATAAAKPASSTASGVSKNGGAPPPPPPDPNAAAKQRIRDLNNDITNV